MTILILFQQSGYRTFKGFYTQHVQRQLARRVPPAGELHPLRRADAARAAAAGRLSADPVGRLHRHQLRRLHRPRASATTRASASIASFAVDARRGKTSVGWFYGFKLHLVVNDRGELLAVLPDAGQRR